MCENSPVFLRNSFPQFNTADAPETASVEPRSSVQVSKDHHTGAARFIYCSEETLVA